MKELTKAEERIMLIFWEIEKGFVKDVIEKIPDDPKPPYNTISSVIRLLVEKGYLNYKAYGKTHEYYPAIKKSQYRKTHMKKVISDYFSNSPSSMISYMVNEENLSKEEIKKLKDIINNMD
jgi:BlaI family transcriptional regulator, penicillinase repressor